MNQDYGTNLGEVFASAILQKFYEESLAPMITNRDYEGEVKDATTKLNILQVESEGVQDYTGADFTYADIKEIEATLTTDQQKLVKFKAKTINKLKSYADPENTLMEQKRKELEIAVDTFVLGLHTKAAAGNRVGTNYTTGTVTVDVTTGAVTGSGTTFTSAMVGRGFKATGHTKWYRVKTYTSATAIVIEDDYDDQTGAYTGGAISAGATYVIEAATSVQVTASTIYGKILDLRQKLQAKKTPTTGRFLVVNSDISRVLNEASVITRAVESDTTNIKNGFMGRIAGFDVYENENIAGDATNGFYILAGHKSAIVFAEALTESKQVELQSNFGFGHAMLMVYGAKVPDVRKGALAVLYCKQ